MGDVSGPVSTLPGARFPAQDGMMCDDHPGRPAIARVQGETDSFGAEYLDLCEACIAELRQHAQQERIGRCDWCKTDATDLRPRRDYEEGMAGRVYRVCGACVKRETERLLEDWEESSRCWDDGG
jgi:hypothetical protein